MRSFPHKSREKFRGCPEGATRVVAVHCGVKNSCFSCTTPRKSVCTPGYIQVVSLASGHARPGSTLSDTPLNVTTCTEVYVTTRSPSSFITLVEHEFHKKRCS